MDRTDSKAVQAGRAFCLDTARSFAKVLFRIEFNELMK